MSYKSGSYKRLGDYIQEVSTRNSSLSATKLMGINIEKYFMPSVANIIGTDLSAYKVVSKNQFACNLMHVGRDEKIPVALNQGDDIIVSPAYFVFEICNPCLLPEYLLLVFKRPEFDRNAWFHTDGDVRGGMNKDGLKDLLIPIPSIKDQQRIIDQYNAIQKRIENNQQTIVKLEETAQAIYRKMFVDEINSEDLPEGWRKGTISDLGRVIGGATPSTEIKEYWVNEGIPWLSPADMPRNVMFIDRTIKHISEEAYNSASTNLLPKGTVLFSSRAPIGLMGITDIELCTNQGYKSVVPFEEYGSYFVYYTLKDQKDNIARQEEGSTFAEISGKELAAYPIILPKIEDAKEFNKTIAPIADYRKGLERECILLNTLLSLLSSKLS